MKSQEKDPLKLTLSELQAQEWCAVQPYGTWLMASLIGIGVLEALDLWLHLPNIIEFSARLILSVITCFSGAKAGKIRKRRDAEQKEAMERRWKEQDEQLLKTYFLEK